MESSKPTFDLAAEEREEEFERVGLNAERLPLDRSSCMRGEWFPF